jgi:hypothetical protein
MARDLRILDVDPVLAKTARLADLGRALPGERVTATILLVLFGAGAGVATVALDLNLRVPGHAILRSLLPMALGLSLVPRRGGGTVMSIAACAAVLGLGTAGGGRVAGPGALTSLLLLGPLLDIGLLTRRTGGSLVAVFLICGLAVNVVAFGVRLGVKLVEPAGRRPVSEWWPGALGSYAVCGLVAGLIASLLFFRLRPARGEGEGRE